ncbi:MAG TPA: hypothetical protein VGQ62_01850 [Chloroflexota bacterium]|jgi:uncharacterized membrane protein YphA (DoxX/SURF4 family)|nr:hypothetical protein [Chloroflexota bacterium]
MSEVTLPTRRGHSRITGAIRLVVAVWLIISAVRTLADPQGATNEQHVPLGALLPLAGLSFTLGVFLLTGFMSRVIGLVLLGLGIWETLNLGVGLIPAALAVFGVYLMLRGGGAWAMDIYVQKMQDRARQKQANEAAQRT